MPSRFQPTRMLLTVLVSLLLALVILYLGEYCGWRWVREAGGEMAALLWIHASRPCSASAPNAQQITARGV